MVGVVKRKIKTMPPEEKAMYAKFMLDFPFCMACGWVKYPFTEFGFILKLENAHIVGGPGRRHDRRAIVRLCNRCHRLSHGDRIVWCGEQIPVMTQGNLVYLKSVCDKEWYDKEYLDSISTGVCAETLPLVDWYNKRLQLAIAKGKVPSP